ncbi:MAG: DUF4190 domain-containing protein [bacterium]
MFCSSCGTQVDNNAQFCPHCGTKFVQIPTAVVSPEPLSPPPVSSVPGTAPIPTPSIPGKASGQAITSLVLGILGLICCGILAPIAWILGSSELSKINTGISSPEGKGYATAGKILGIIGTVLLVLGMLWAILWIGFAFSSMAFRAPFSHQFRPF